MKCYCVHTDQAFTLKVEAVEEAFCDVIKHAWFEPTETGFKKVYSIIEGNGITQEDIDVIGQNFEKLGPKMFEGMLDCHWEEALETFAQICLQNQIEWYVFGSISDVLRGIKVKPHDIDIIVHTRDFFKLKSCFMDCLVEPFVDNKGTWVVRYFGRLCIDGVLFDVAAQETLDRENHTYDRVIWRGFEIDIETFENRHKLEIQRGRQDRLKAMEDYKLLNPKVGDIITFGHYDWCILDVKEDRMLIITKEIIFQKPYNDFKGDVTWKESSLRKYLNTSFYESFAHDDKLKIIKTKHHNPDNPWYGSRGGEDTEDVIFVLNLDETVSHYFGDSSQNLINRSPKQRYWFQKKDINNEKRRTGYQGYIWWWWTRTPGRDNKRAVYIHGDGNIGIQGNGTYKYSSNTQHPITLDNSGGVRPALWLSREYHEK